MFVHLVLACCLCYVQDLYQDGSVCFSSLFDNGVTVDMAAFQVFHGIPAISTGIIFHLITPHSLRAMGKFHA